MDFRRPTIFVADAQRDGLTEMLLNEFLKEHKTVQEQGAVIAQIKANAVKQEATIARQQEQIKALTAGLQKVNNRVELTKPAPQTVMSQ